MPRRGPSGNWQPPVVSGSALPLTIKRTTSDGIYTLTQVFNRNTAEPAVKITMTLKNNTAVSRDFMLVRYADIDANNAHSGDYANWFDEDHQSAWGYNNELNVFGVMLYSALRRRLISRSSRMNLSAPTLATLRPSPRE
jgi:hypothetical protein